MIKEIIFCVAGSLFFAVTMRVPKGCFKYVTIGAAITASCERLLTRQYGEFAACLLAMLCLVFFCEIVSRAVKIPSTVILLPSVIPLLPGSSIYYTMLYLINADTDNFVACGKSTFLTGLGIALGAVIATIIIRFLKR